MTHILIVAALVVSFSISAFAAKRYYNRASPDDCRIVNIAPSYAKTTIRKGKRVYHHQADGSTGYGHHLQAGSGVVGLVREVCASSPNVRKGSIHLLLGFLCRRWRGAVCRSCRAHQPKSKHRRR